MSARTTPARVPAGHPTGGQFTPTARPEADVPLVESPLHTVPAFLRDQFMYGDCLHLAHALAERNPGWGVLVVGEAVEDDDGEWETGTLQHAYAVRPDGALVDAVGVHPHSAAEDLSRRSGWPIHEYSTADAAEEVWFVSVMDLAGETEPGEMADHVMGHWGSGPIGTVVTVDEADTNPEEPPPPTREQVEKWVTGFFADEEYGEPYDNVCAGSRTANGMCAEVSEAFVSYLYDVENVDASTIDMHAADHPYIPDGSPHTVVEVDGMIIDLTHLQFDDGAEHPYIAPTEEYLKGWDVVSW